MSISGLSENVSIHQTLGDNPNTDNNLSADELKALFDQAAEILKAYLNNIVVPEINRLAPLAEAGDENSEEALSKLAEMQNSITWALNKVDSALTTAESAKTIAEEAEVKSNGAYSFASQANQQAKNAGDLARTAISQASGAVQLANQAKEAADNANENSAEALEKMNNSLPLSGGILTGPLSGTIATMGKLIAMGSVVLSAIGYDTIYFKNVSDEGNPAVEISTMESPGGGPVRLTNIGTPQQNNDAANMAYVLSEIAKAGPGAAGEDGGYYTISVSQPSNDKMRVTLTPSKPDMPTVPAVDIDLPAGEDGQDGKSPTVTVTDITGGHRITVTDATGTKTFNVMDGATGADGSDGNDGADGGYYTPAVDQAIPGSISFGFTPSKSNMPTIKPTTIPLPAGPKGDKGDTGPAGAGLPAVTAADNGKIAGVVDGLWGLVDASDGAETNVDRTITLDASVSSVNIGSAANPLNLKRCVILLDINHDYTVRESTANGRIKTNGYNQGVILQNMIIPTDATYDRPYMIYMEAFGEIVYCFVASFNTTDDIVSNDNTVEGNMTWRAGRLIADNGRINTINIIGDAVDAGAFGAGTKIRIVGVE